MALLRCLFRIFALLAWSVFVALISIPWRLKRGLAETRKIAEFTKLWDRGVARIINVKIKISGPIPSGKSGLIVSNHLSYIDIAIHGSIVPVRYSVRADVAGWPVLGWYIGLSHPIWTRRESRQSSLAAQRSFTKTMKRGIYLIVYPEGTSTDGKRGILPFKSTSFEAAIIGNVPVYPVLIRYREVPDRPTVCWYGDMTLLPHVWQLLRFDRIDAELRFLGSVYPEGRGRKELASFVHDIMAKEYERWNGLSS